jgi:hypothetical protein
MNSSEVPHEWWAGMDVDEPTRTRRDMRILDRGDVFDTKIAGLAQDLRIPTKWGV